MDPILEHHFLNIANGTAKQNEDGTLSTVRTAIVNIDGRETLIPTIWDGEEQPLEVAIEKAIESGVNWPKAYGETAVQQLEEQDAEIHSFTDENGKLLMSDDYTPEEARAILDQVQQEYDDKDEGEQFGFKDGLKLAGAAGLLGLEKIGVDTSPIINWYKGGDTGFALGGIATATKGITTEEGREMAAKKFQVDDKKADTNGDGELTTREKEVASAVQRNVDEEILEDEKVQMYHGGMACGCDECMGGDLEAGIAGYDEVSGNPIPVGASAENVRDDISAMISEGEYVLPAHVVSWHGLKHIQEMQQEAEAGLMMMELDGLIQHVEQSETEEVEDEDIDVPEEDVDVEVATVEVDDQLEDTEEELEPVSKPLPAMLKKQKIAFMV